jgi:hypothetical protein
MESGGNRSIPVELIGFNEIKIESEDAYEVDLYRSISAESDGCSLIPWNPMGID